MEKFKKFCKDHTGDIIMAASFLGTIGIAVIAADHMVKSDRVTDIVSTMKDGKVVDQVVTYANGRTAHYVTEHISES